MSKVEVNQVTQQCGTTLTVGGGACKTAVVDATTVTLGRCGGTVSLASGATQSGFGRTGTVDWITTPKVTGDSPITGVTGKGYFLNTTAGAITLNLPAGAAGSIVSMADYAATWQTNNVTVTPNGSEKIGGTAASSPLSTEGQSVTFVYVDSTQGWVNTMDSTSNVRGTTYMAASVSGACNTLATAPDCADVKIATFLGPGTFTVCTTSNIADNNLVSYMVVGGGGGGAYNQAGGGGAGGYREVESPSTPYTSSPLNGYPTPANRITVTATGYPIVVGGGGTGETTPGPTTNAPSGVNSTFSTITGAGGGGGGGASAVGVDGGSGSGGGGSGPGKAGGSGNTPSTIPAQGFNGGDGNEPDGGGGGGGGASAVGADSIAPREAGAGGAGVTTSINATPTQRAGGGGGGAGTGTGGAGGAGGGGKGGTGNQPSPSASVAGTVNTGGGGGGGGNQAGANEGSAGGSGIVIIRYKFQ